MNFRFGFFECVSPGICEAARSNPQVRNSYRVGRRLRTQDPAGSLQAGHDRISDPAENFEDMLSPNSREHRA